MTQSSWPKALPRTLLLTSSYKTKYKYMIAYVIIQASAMKRWAWETLRHNYS